MTAAISRTGAKLTALAAIVAWGCATPPKPAELEALEKMREAQSAKTAAQKQPALMRTVDTYLGRAQEKWQDNELDDSRKQALMGQIKLKHAIALTEQDQAKRRLAAAEADLAEADDQYGRAEKELAALNEQVALLNKLVGESARKQQLEAQLSAEKQAAAVQIERERLKAAAQEKINQAEIALKEADTVSAKRHAAGEYQSALDTLARAQAEQQQGELQAAIISADMARTKAAQAIALATPLYKQETDTEAKRARAEALARDAAMLPGILVRREARGSLQRLVLPIPSKDLFIRTNVSIAPGRDAVLNQIAALIGKYPDYPVHVVGHTDNRGRPDARLATSLARAQAVFSALVQRGVDAKRMVATGLGGDEPITDNRTAAGRERNHRIEVIFLYQ